MCRLVDGLAGLLSCRQRAVAQLPPDESLTSKEALLATDMRLTALGRLAPRAAPSTAQPPQQRPDHRVMRSPKSRQRRHDNDLTPLASSRTQQLVGCVTSPCVT